MKDRIENLEMHLAEHERMIEDLSDVITRQELEIERLRRKLELLDERFGRMEEQAAPDVPVTKPPHY